MSPRALNCATVHCDICGTTLDTEPTRGWPDPQVVRREAAGEGWVYRNGLDLCWKCSQ